jgi:chemotaxis protein CheX
MPTFAANRINHTEGIFTMTLAQVSTQQILYSCMEHAVQGVLPSATIQPGSTNQEDSIVLAEFHVVLGFIGDQKGKIIFNGNKSVFYKLGELLFGMPLSEEMLPSFAGELGNMVGGNFATSLSSNAIIIDITPPSVIEGESKMFGLEGALSFYVQLPGGERLEIILSQKP